MDDGVAVANQRIGQGPPEKPGSAGNDNFHGLDVECS
jgi:hypothetical protein